MDAFEVAEILFWRWLDGDDNDARQLWAYLANLVQADRALWCAVVDYIGEIAPPMAFDEDGVLHFVEGE